MWLGSSVFDGARAFEGVTPDLDRHCARVNASAKALGLEPTLDIETMVGLVGDGVKKFAPDAALYIRPMYWAEQGGYMSVPPDPASTRFLLCLYETPMPPPSGFSVTLSPFRRPTVESMPTDAKAGAFTPITAAPSWKPRRAASTTRSCATCWAISPRQAHRTSSWPKTGWC
jgi:branched-chain amino acid aminotransferase